MTAFIIIVTIAMVVLLVTALLKGLDTRFTLMGLGVVLFLIAGIVNPTSVPEVTGYWFVDIFEEFATQCIKTFTSPGIVIVLLFGYVGYMDSLKANDLFAIYATKPLKGIKHKYVMVAVAYILTFVIMQVMALTSAACAALLAGTMYPILRSVGVSKKTVVCLLLAGTSYFIGPGNTFMLIALDNMGSTMPIAENYVAAQIPVMIPTVLLVSVLVALANQFFDKKDRDVLADEDYGEEKDPESLGVPKIYALLPVLPLLFVFVFNFFLPQLKASIQAISVFTFFVAFIIVMLVNKDKKATYQGTTSYFKGMSNAFFASLCLTIGCNYFGSALTSIGGVKLLVNFLTSLNLGFIPMVIVFLIATYAVTYATSIMLAVTIFTPVVGEYLVSLGRPDLIVPMCMILVVAGGSCMMISPTKPPLLLLSGMFDVPIKEITKRNILPSIASAILITVISLIIL